jgi:hypothetical protein
MIVPSNKGLMPSLVTYFVFHVDSWFWCTTT